MDPTQQMIMALQGQQGGMHVPNQNMNIAQQNMGYGQQVNPSVPGAPNPAGMPGSMGGDMYGGMFGAPPMTPPPQGIY